MKTVAIACFLAFQIHGVAADGWTTVAPREEIRPEFQKTETGGKSGHGALVIRADEREGLHGWWQNTFSVTGGQTIAFSPGVARSTSRWRAAACWPVCFGAMTLERRSSGTRAW